MLATVVLGIIALSLPSPEPAAAYSATQLTTAWNVEYSTQTLQESARSVTVRGTWRRGYGSGYLGGRALTSWQRGARLSVTFRGTGIALVGPRSTRRGSARIYVNGRRVRTVSAYATTPQARQALFVATWDSVRTRTVTVEVVGTRGHPAFTVDAFVVRRAKKPQPLGAIPPSPVPTPEATPAPEATPGASPTATPPTEPVPGPTATPSPAPTPAPTPAPQPSSAPPPGDPFAVPFLGRAPSAAIHLRAPCDGAVIRGRQFQNLSTVAIIVEGCRNVTITENDFDGTVGGVFALNSENVVVTYNRFRGIGNGTIGSGRSNYVQFNNVTGGSISHNKGVGGNTEDLISVFQSSGTASAPLIVEHNALEGTNWTRSSGTGIIVGDGGGGNYVTIRYNRLLTPGQVGIQLINGIGVRVHGNTVYAAPRSPLTSPNVGMSSWEGSPNADVYENRVRWYRNDGSQNPRWWGYGTIRESANDWYASIDPETLRVRL